MGNFSALQLITASEAGLLGDTDDLWKLETTMPKMLDLIDRVEYQSHKKQAADLLPHIKDAVFEAEDLLDELDYDALKWKVECSKNLGLDRLRDTCLEFYESVRSNDYIRKVNRIQKNLDHVHKQSMEMGLHQAPLKFDKSVRPETTSYFNCEEKMIGREKEMKELVGKLGVHSRKRGRTESKARMTELHVFSIVGMGGVGKTTMAQHICKDTNVKNHFGAKNIIWTCVSDDFDIKRLTKDIVERLGGDASSNSLEVLMGKLEGCVKSKKFLLVLDDMWGDILKDDGVEWKRFCAPLKNGVEGSRILVTTRSPEVAKLVGPMNNYELKGLKDSVFLEFFKFCAFGSKTLGNNRESLERIGEIIVPKLKGSPLAAKTIGRLLRMDLSTTHWGNIMESELWRLEQTETDILPALRLSYMYLPQKLKRCFSICAMFPKDYKFAKDFLADIWIALGYVESAQEASMCFDALANRSFFQKASPHSVKYVIHDLMHDTAQLVSKNECFIIKHASDLDKVPSNVRHLSIFTNGDVQCSELKSICNKKNLRSLVCDESYSKAKDFESMMDCWFKELLKICVFSCKLSKVRQLPENMGNSKHMRHLCLLGSSNFSTFPSTFCQLHHLKVIDRGSCLIESFPPGFSDALSLEKINSNNFAYNKDHSGKLCLKWPFLHRKTVKMVENQMERLPHWNLQHLHVKNYRGESCPSWLQPNLLPMLRSLEFHWCEVKSIPFFVPLDVSLDSTPSDNINRLEELVIYYYEQISWEGSMLLPTSLRKLTLVKSGYSMDRFVSCFLDLTSLTYLEIKDCESLTSIPLHVWRRNLPALEELYIEGCDNLTSIVSEASGSSSSSAVTGFLSLAKLMIKQCSKLLSFDEFLKPDCLPAVNTILVSSCSELMSISVDGLEGLQTLEISCCDKLNAQRAVILPSSLKKLKLVLCGGIESINLANNQLGRSPVLEELHIYECLGLKSIGGAAAVDKIKKVYINGCLQLSEIQPWFWVPPEKTGISAAAISSLAISSESARGTVVNLRRSQEEVKCNYVEWVDPEWSVPTKFCLRELWSMFDEKLRQNVKNAEDKCKLVGENRRMEEELRYFKMDFAKLVADKEDALTQLGNARLSLSNLKEELEKNKMADHGCANLHQVLRVKAEKDRDRVVLERDQVMRERDQLKQEKKKLEYIIIDFLKQKHGYVDKIKKLKEICDEI
ncbi:putative disease resistance protein RGA1 [Triticum aestivum]|uniref:putative disease resistance protein RGA1 n=1 Tax=Triticum aestivum TaxID=4565 RepID=UPI001D01F13B|nr:putative disease resistance protein RGA1 [Triticum aestivum]